MRCARSRPLNCARAARAPRRFRSRCPSTATPRPGDFSYVPTEFFLRHAPCDFYRVLRYAPCAFHTEFYAALAVGGGSRWAWPWRFVADFFIVCCALARPLNCEHTAGVCVCARTVTITQRFAYRHADRATFPEFYATHCATFPEFYATRCATFTEFYARRRNFYRVYATLCDRLPSFTPHTLRPLQ